MSLEWLTCNWLAVSTRRGIDENGERRECRRKRRRVLVVSSQIPLTYLSSRRKKHTDLRQERIQFAAPTRERATRRQFSVCGGEKIVRCVYVGEQGKDKSTFMKKKIWTRGDDEVSEVGDLPLHHEPKARISTPLPMHTSWIDVLLYIRTTYLTFVSALLKHTTNKKVLFFYTTLLHDEPARLVGT